MTVQKNANGAKMNFKNNKVLPAVWIIFHAIILCAPLVCMAAGKRFALDTNLFSIIPSNDKTLDAADRKLSEKSGRNFFILTSAQKFDDAKSTAATVYESLKKSSAFDTVSLYTDATVMQSINDFTFRERFNLLDKKTVKLLEQKNGARTVADAALTQVYGAFSFASLDKLESDPFLLSSVVQQSYMQRAMKNGTRFSLKDGVLATSYENEWYVMIRGTLSAEGASLTNKESGVKKIYDVCSPLSTDNVHFVFSGVPFHSYESSTSAQTEISIISTVSLVIVLIILIMLFKSVLPVFLSMASILVSSLAAFASTITLFGGMHILTFVFGTTLIGTCLDYSVHFFVNRTANHKIQSGKDIRKYLFRGLTLSLASTEICYLVLLGSPFTLLKQVAVFSLVGIGSAYLTVICMYPLLPPAKKQSDIASHVPQIVLSKKISISILAAIAAVSCCVLVVFRKDVRVENNLSSLYSMKGKLLEDEKKSARVIDYGSTGWYFIVAGKSEEELLQREENLCAKLDGAVKDGNLASYLAVTSFIPSAKTQTESYNAAGNLLPVADEQLALLGFEQTAHHENLFAAEYKSCANHILTPDSSDVPPYLSDMLSSVWIGKAGDTYYSAVMPLHAHDEGLFRTLASETEGVSFINKVKDIGTELDKLTRQMLLLFLVSYIVVFVVLLFFYKIHNALCIIIVPVLITLVTVAVLSASSIPLSFFPVTGLVLVFGLGLDYIIYTVESQNQLTTLSIFISFITTALSFGALALSSFVPVHIFGLTVFTGLTTAYVCSLLITGLTKK